VKKLIETIGLTATVIILWCLLVGWDITAWLLLFGMPHSKGLLFCASTALMATVLFSWGYVTKGPDNSTAYLDTTLDRIRQNHPNASRYSWQEPDGTFHHVDLRGKQNSASTQTSGLKYSFKKD
jgi:hypothetical protein